MMLCDELIARGDRALNFCDIRTGQFRGDPKRLMKVLEWISARPSVRVLLVNIFAGITDLSEFADLLCTALERTPSLQVPVVARLVGSRVEQARALLAARRPDIAVGSAHAASDVEAVLAGQGMIDQLTRSTPVIVQGATGRTGRVQVARMLAYGTRIVAGVSIRAAVGDVEGVPVFQDCAAAVAATGARVSLAMVPPMAS
jgi:hypothetical protein